MKKPIPKVTWLGRAVAYYPTILMLLFVTDLIWLIRAPGLLPLAVLPGIVYALPLLTHRIHNLLFRLTDSRMMIPSGKYPPWWGSFHIQRIYLSLPILESLIRLVPGAFSLWLRAWGSQIGKNIYWAPSVEIADRSLLEIGDFTSIGHNTAFYCHVLTPAKDGRLLVYVKKIKIGSFVFVGSYSRVGPGVHISDKVKINAGTDLHVNQKVEIEENEIKNL